tara:strand:+ start:2955 stop:3617 length:663 start_codon:yes stop_codon:yes gene_type:complete
MRSITAFLNVRKESKRCPNKMLKPFAGTTLFDIALEKLKLLDVDEKYVCARDDEFLDRDMGKDIKKYRRSKDSVTLDGPLSTVFESFSSFTSDYVMFINGSHAHVKVGTLQEAVNRFKELDYKSSTSVNLINDWLFRMDGSMLYPATDLSHGDTKLTSPLYRVAHVFHIYNIARFFQAGGMFPFKINDPYMHLVPKQESIDIDDSADFKISEAVYRTFSC